MLLTSSQVQVVLSSGIVFIFTLLLFLSGYVVQQRSVAQLQTAIRPRAPSPRHQPPPTTEHIQSNPTSRLSRPFGKLRDRAKLQAHFVDKNNPFDWSRLAYAQVVRDHSELCNALVLFNSLHRLRSPAPKLLLFPKEWILDNDGYLASQEVETSRRLLKKAARWYQTTLVPIEPDLKDANVTDPSSFSIAALYAMTQFDRILTFPPPGLILNASPLDSILAYSSTSQTSAFPSYNTSTSLSSLVLVAPSTQSHKALTELIRKQPHLDSLELLKYTFPAPPPLLKDDSEEQFPTKVYATSSLLRTMQGFSAKVFEEETAFIHLADPELPGPEYDIPYADLVRMRPKDDDQGFVWEKMYSIYKDKRYSVCGMDLLPWNGEVRSEEKKVDAAEERREDTVYEMKQDL
ncbi:glycosyltransferase family 8 protein [Venturia nashicola]|uniref:Glycosyltransferase family 8 protein n=1 Tax=Venturia nashicola TaxID=86259 RepID=A0A4Z1NH73_9PEZI|nr:glycosyltransferase family 8 protein [Venturia nashicola]TLD21567.1 glycosyltransferase family 8 protein [Venturia nashicola]